MCIDLWYMYFKVIYLTQMATCWSINTLLVTCIAILIKHVSSAQYCTIFCDSGCRSHGCEENTVTIVIGSIAGGICAISLAVGLTIICMGYVRKKSKKKRIKHLNADSERETMKENEIRKIEMDCSNCKLIIIRKDKKKIIVAINEDIMSIQREEDLETSDLPDDLGDTPPKPKPPPSWFTQQIANTRT